MLVALACIPHMTLPYEAVPLLLVPRTTRQMLILAALSYVPLALVDTAALPDLPSRVDAAGRVITVALYLPALLMVLRRPNEGVMPTWLEARLAAVPSWLRGRSLADA